MGNFNKKNLANKEKQEVASNFVKRRQQLSGGDSSLSKISTIKDINMDTIFKIFGKKLAKGGSVKKKKKFPDLSGDGKVTRKDILMAKGVIKKKKGKKRQKREDNMALNNPKPKFINGSLYPNAKMTVSTDMNPYKGPHVNKTSIADVYSASMEGPKVTQNLGSGPKGQRSKVQIKKVAFKGLK